MTALTPVMPVRHRFGTVGEAARVVHLISVPVEQSAAVSALCGEVLSVRDVETVSVGEGMPCDVCLLNQSINMPDVPSTGSTERMDPTQAIDGTTYQIWGWPVTQRGDHVRLTLNGGVSAFAMPAELGIAVTRILIAHRCAPATLIHPYLPDHHVILTGERYGVALRWPSSVHLVTGCLPLPPTVTCRGAITWTGPPTKDSLRLCREIDVFAALRSALNRPPKGEAVTKTDDDKNEDDDNKDEAGQHRDEDNTGDASRDRPIPPPPDPNKHDR